MGLDNTDQKIGRQIQSTIIQENVRIKLQYHGKYITYFQIDRMTIYESFRIGVTQNQKNYNVKDKLNDRKLMTRLSVEWELYHGH